VYICWSRTWADKCLGMSSGRRVGDWASISRESCSSLRALRPGSLQGPPPNPALYCVDSVGTRGGEIAFSDQTLWSASLSRDRHCPERPSAVQVLPTLWPYKRYCSYTPRRVACGEAPLSGESVPQSSNFSSAAVEEISQPIAQGV
jgi:hypothetical protein